MKIICNKDEFAKLVRFCLASEIEDGCTGCLFSGVCSKGNTLKEDDWMTGIEDLCKIEVSNG